jgi:subtilisin family serine protease
VGLTWPGWMTIPSANRSDAEADASARESVGALDLVRLRPLMTLTSGIPEIGIGLLDGPVAIDHPDLAGTAMRTVRRDTGACQQPRAGACVHGTFVAGILAARRGSPAPAICPDCTLLVRPIFRETGEFPVPAATPDDVGIAITECVAAGARIVNLSAATGRPDMEANRKLRHALDYAVRHGALVVAAAGNEGMMGSWEVTRHPGVIPVVSYDLAGRPSDQSNFGRSAGRWGLGAPGHEIVSLASEGLPVSRTGTSFATAFVSGAIALLWSIFPAADPGRVRHALSQGLRRTSVIPPLMNAEAAYEHLRNGSPCR